MSTSSTISPVFCLFRTELDGKHDKYERLVKLSRDITVASKRIIFEVHRIDGESDQEKSLIRIGEKLAELDCAKWQAVARELQGEDPFQYLRAYSPGMQEYIEAVALWHYVAKRNIISLKDVQERLAFTQTSSVDAANSHSVPSSTNEDPPALNVPSSKLTVYIPPAEYILGISDVAGELMRLAVHSVGVGDKETPFVICRTLRELCTSMSSLYGIARDLPQKLSSLRQSLAKVEAACYAIHVRGSELPDHLLTSMLSFRPTVPVIDDLGSADLD